MILGGEDDLRTPFEQDEQIALGYSNVRLLEIPATGHSTFTADFSGCAQRAAIAFLGSGTVPGPCPTPSVPQAVPLPPASLGAVHPARSSSAFAGRVAAAVALTLEDVFGQPPPSGGGLRGGSWERRGSTKVALRDLVDVDGVQVSGTVTVMGADDLVGTLQIRRTPRRKAAPAGPRSGRPAGQPACRRGSSTSEASALGVALTAAMAVTAKPASGQDDDAQDGNDRFRTLSGAPIKELYTATDLPAGAAGPEDPIGLPGEYPFTRGIHASMYRGRLWTMRQFAGFGTSEETNARFHYLLDHGQTGLSTAFDMPSLMGHDSDHPRSLGEVGREGVAVDTPQDMRTLFGGIDLGEVSVSMTINAPAAIMLAFYVVAAESDPAHPTPPEQLSGTIQADILKEYIAQKEWCFPVDPGMRLCGDMIEWCSHRMPRWHPISISGYHIREAGSTAQQELAFTLKDGLTYVEQAVERGLDVDDFAPRLSFFFNAQIDFFEEIAKYRAARRIWAREMRETFGARNPRSWQMRFHAQTAGV